MAWTDLDALASTSDGDMSWGTEMRGAMSTLRTLETHTHDYAASTHTHTDLATKTDTLKAAQLAQANLVPPNGDTAGQNHSGTTWDGSHFRWKGRILLLGTGRGSHWSVDGYYSIPMPADGTVIGGTGGAADATVVAAGIPIGPHTALYVLPTAGGGASSYTLGLYGYSAGTFALPPGAVFIAGQTENDSSNLLRTGWGNTLDYWRNVAFQNAWANYNAEGGTWETCQYRRHTSGLVEVKGLIKAGTLGATAFTLPVGYRPRAGIHAMTFSNGTEGGVRVYADGQFIVGNPGSNTWFSCRIPPFYADN